MNRQESQPFSLEDRSTISDYLKRVDQYRDAKVIGRALAEISMEFGRLNLRELFDILRKQQSSTFFVALPISDQPEYVSRLPHSGEQEYPYYLYICVKDEQEYLRKLEEQELSPGLNLQRFDTTGLLVPRPGTQIGIIMNAPSN